MKKILITGGAGFIGSNLCLKLVEKNYEVTVIDYGVGNLLSVQRGFEKCGAEVRLDSDPRSILTAKRVVLPGVGAFANAMAALKNYGLIQVIQEIAKRNTPLLGICLGMELLFQESSEFGTTRGLGLIPGFVTSIPRMTKESAQLKIPHIGWNSIHPSRKGTKWKDSILSKNEVSSLRSFSSESSLKRPKRLRSSELKAVGILTWRLT